MAYPFIYLREATPGRRVAPFVRIVGLASGSGEIPIARTVAEERKTIRYLPGGSGTASVIFTGSRTTRLGRDRASIAHGNQRGARAGYELAMFHLRPS